MVDTCVNIMTVLAPFLAAYPPWVSCVVLVGVLLTPVVVLAFVLARTGHTKEQSTGGGSQRIAGASLVIRGVEVYLAPPNVGVHVIAKVNSTEYVYPHVSGEQWREVRRTDLSPQSFTLPPTSRGYEVSFKLVVSDALHDTQFDMVSQWVEKIPKPPFSGKYYVHAMLESPKWTHILAVVYYDIQEGGA
jgi:hypothetical protein